MQNSGTFSVQYNGYTIGCSIAAVPWQGEEDWPMGWQWTGTDILLWGSAVAAILLMCVLGVCCYSRMAASREYRLAETLLESDKQLMQELLNNHESKKDATTNNNGTYNKKENK